MEISRRTIFLLSGVGVTSLILAGCSNDSKDKDKMNFDRSKINPTEISRFINNYYHESYESSLNNFKNGKDLDRTLLNIIGVKKYYEITQARDPYFALSRLSSEEKDKISDAIDKFNSTSGLYKTDDLNSDQKLYLNISVISLNNTLPSAWSKADWSITADPHKISFKDNEATIKYSDLIYMYDGRKQNVKVLPGGAEILNLVLDDNEWKINGRKHIDQLLKLGVGLNGDRDS